MQIGMSYAKHSVIRYKLAYMLDEKDQICMNTGINKLTC